MNLKTLNGKVHAQNFGMSAQDYYCIKRFASSSSNRLVVHFFFLVSFMSLIFQSLQNDGGAAASSRCDIKYLLYIFNVAKRGKAKLCTFQCELSFHNQPT